MTDETARDTPDTRSENRDPAESARSRRKLNGLNFFAADVGDGIGPFLGIYLISLGGWREASIGLVLFVLNISTVLAQAPAGWMIDRTPHKRRLIMGAAIVIAAAVLVIPLHPTFAIVMLCSGLVGAAAAIIPPATAAITLGIFGPPGFTRQMGSNQAFNHAGNVFAALAIGLVSFFFWPPALFPLTALLATGTAITVMLIRQSAINDVLACGGPDSGSAAQMADGEAASFRAGRHAILGNRPLLVFFLCIGLFHLANASMLPLAGQMLSLGGQKDAATLYMSGCVIVAQLVMIGVAILVGLRADRWGRKVFLLAGFAVLPLRGILFGHANGPFDVLAIQTLDGVGAGIYSVVAVLIVADLTRGTGHFNLAQGWMMTVQGFGASFGNYFGEWLAGASGYSVAFHTLTVIALAALLIVWIAVPETMPGRLEEVALSGA